MCCGKKRAQARQTNRTNQKPRHEKKATLFSQPKSDSPPLFQYLGETGLTVMGPRTHKRYRFNHPGAVVAVDPRDWRAMTAVSILQQVE